MGYCAEVLVKCSLYYSNCIVKFYTFMTFVQSVDHTESNYISRSSIPVYSGHVNKGLSTYFKRQLRTKTKNAY